MSPARWPGRETRWTILGDVIARPDDSTLPNVRRGLREPIETSVAFVKDQEQAVAILRVQVARWARVFLTVVLLAGAPLMPVMGLTGATRLALREDLSLVVRVVVAATALLAASVSLWLPCQFLRAVRARGRVVFSPKRSS